MEHHFPSGGNLLVAHVARPPMRADVIATPAVVLAHGYPSEVSATAVAAAALPELADRLAAEMGWLAMALAFRGCGGSEGSFSLAGWLDDISAAVTYLRENERVTGVWLAGFGTGGALALCAAAADPEVRGVAALGAPADFDDWASHPKRLLEHAREVGIITDPTFPADVDAWTRELRELRAVACAPKVAPRPLLVVHGSDDDLVPVFDARVLVDAHGDAELRIMNGAGHRVRHDPRAIAVLLGWLDRVSRLPRRSPAASSSEL
jgi:pimeloyl-ACP methyl ester carboxylesterase